MSRTRLQKEANRIDEKLYDVIDSAVAMRESLPQKERKDWDADIAKLRFFRERLRKHMHEGDRKGTEGKW